MFSFQRHTDSSRMLAAPTLESEPATYRVLAAERKELSGLSFLLRTFFDRSASDESEGADAVAGPSLSLSSLLPLRKSEPRSVPVSPPTFHSSSQSAQVATVNISLYSYPYAGIGDHNSQRNPRHDLLHSSRQQSVYSHAYTSTPSGLFDYPSTTWPGILSGSGSAPSRGSSFVTSTRPNFEVLDSILKRRYGRDALRDAVRGTRERMEHQYALSMLLYNQVTLALVALGIISNVIALCLILRALRSRSRY